MYLVIKETERESMSRGMERGGGGGRENLKQTPVQSTLPHAPLHLF